MTPSTPATMRTQNRPIRWVAGASLSVVAVVASVALSAGASAIPTPNAPLVTTTTTTTLAPVPPAPQTVSAYWMAASDGGVFAFGGAPFLGSMGGKPLNKPVVGMATAPNGAGYWEVASDGGIFSFGAAPFYGSTGSIHLNKPIVGMAATTTGKGYWLVASDGGIFAYGDAAFYGSTGSIHLNKPVVGMAPTADNHGYWLVASDGGIFAYGNAGFYGSTGNIQLQKPIVAMAASHGQAGYWMVAADGGIFAYGDAKFYGSLGGVPQSRPVVSMAVTADGLGYWFTNNNGAVTAFGDATYWGSTPQVLSAPVVGITQGTGTGSFTGSSYPSGSYGYDISKYQCPSRGGTLPPAPHSVAIVQVEQPGYLNPCLAQQAAWAGGGLNLYIYVDFGSDPTSLDPWCATSPSPTACNYGFNTAVQAFNDAKAAGINALVPWWLDVEDATLSGHQPDTKALVQGSIDGLRYVGLNSVGIYASPGNWANLVGNYQPAVPYWAADWGIAPSITCANVHSLFAGLPTGPVQIVQYSSPSAPLALGGMDVSYDNDYAC